MIKLKHYLITTGILANKSNIRFGFNVEDIVTYNKWVKLHNIFRRAFSTS